MSLFWRVFATNALLLTIAALVLGVSPITVSWPIALTEALVLTLGLVAMLVANAVLLRPVFEPLERRESGRRAVAAEEAERRRVAHELHDEVGQTMTGVLMVLARLEDAVAPDRRVELAVYRIVQESLTNVARHARAARAWLSLAAGEAAGGLLVRVLDDGRAWQGRLREGGGMRGCGSGRWSWVATW